MKQRTDRARIELKTYSESRFLSDPMLIINEKAQALDMAERDLGDAVKGILADARMKLTALSAKLDGLSPLSVVSRGYGMIFDSTGKVVKSVRSAKKGDNICVELIDGSVSATIDGIKEKRRADRVSRERE